MPHFNLRPEFITVLLQNNLTKLQLFVIILNCVRISDWSQLAQAVNAVLLKEVPLLAILLRNIYSNFSAEFLLICQYNRPFSSCINLT